MCRRPIAALLLVVAALAVAAPAGAQEPRAVRSANVTWLGNLPERDPISIAIHGSSMFVSTLRGIAIYDVSRPEAPARLSFLPLQVWQNEDVSTNGEILLVSRDAGLGLARLHVIDVRDPARPALLSTLDTSPLLRRRYESLGHTATCVDGCRFAYLAGAGRIDVVDLRDPANPRFASPRSFQASDAACARPRRRGCFGTHDVQVDARGVAWVTGAGGTAGYDIGDPLRPRRVASTGSRARSTAFSGRGGRRDTLNDFIHHNALRLSEDVVAITEEDLESSDCRRAGRFQTWRIGARGRMTPLDSWLPERDRERSLCSAHYFDARDGIVAQGWYGGGTRFLDVRDPRRIRQVGWYLPDRTESFAAYFAPTDPSGQVVYVVDSQRGVDVVRFDRAARAGASRPARQRRGSGARGEPNVGTRVSNRRSAVRRGQRFATRVRVVNTGRRAVRGVELTVELSEALEHVSGGTVEAGGRRAVFGIGTVRPGPRGRLVEVVARVRGEAPGRFAEVAAVARAGRDVYAVDDFSIDRDTIGRSRGATASTARPPLLLCRPPR
jgi:hypothetical protein